MPTLLTCLPAHHDLRILILAICISLAGSVLGMWLYASAARRVATAAAAHRAALAGALAGLGAWTTHFTAMMAFQPHLQLAYSPIATLASLIVALCGASLSFRLALAGKSRRLHGGAALFGLTVVALHYIGIAAMHAEATVSWNAALICVSVVLVVAGSMAAFALLRWTLWRVAGSGVLLSLSVLALHLCGMRAMTLTPDAGMALGPGLFDRGALTLLVSGAVALLCCMAAVIVVSELRARRQTALRTRRLADSTFEGLAFLSQGRLVQVNKALCQMTGLDAGQLIGREFFDDLFTPETDGLRFAPRSEGLLQTATGRLNVEVLVRSPDEVDAVIVAVRDTSERHEAQTARLLLQAAIEAMPEAVAVFDADDRLRAWNRLYGEVHPECAPLLKTGVTFRELIQRGVDLDYYRDVSTGTPGAEAWIAERLAQHENPGPAQIQHLVDGRYVRVEEQRIAGGGYVSICVDITDLKMKEESLNLLFQRTPMAVWVADPRTARIFAVNEAAVAYYGYERDEFLGMRASNLLPPDEWAAWLALSAEGRLNYDPDRLWRHRRRDGEELLVLPFVRKLTFEGRPAIVITAFDMTERQKAEAALALAKEEAEAANHAKSAFLANMSHEIRTPLNGVVGVADVLANSPLPAAEQAMVEIIRNSGATLERLLSDILDIARVESGQLQVEVEPFALGAAIRDVAALCEMKARESGVSFCVDAAPASDGIVLGDSMRLKQVLTNLLSNALKFTPAGRVELRVEAEGADTYRFTVKDSGVGFDPQIKDRLFGRFQQADGSITRRFGGTGLGLAISRQLAELMGGELDCRSVVGEGSEFWMTLTLPQVQGELSQTTGPSSSPRPEQLASDDAAEAPALSILVADDHPTNRKVLELMLGQAGARLTMVENGQQAVEAYRRESFDLILMDMQMPVQDGLSATSEIRRLEAQDHRRRTPLIMLTANALPEHVSGALAAGADRHHAKPVTAAPLFDAIADLLAEADLAAAA